ncbi:MAG: twin-arginine translocation signal domain-containing protein, partial [Pseudomonadota bacterium]
MTKFYNSRRIHPAVHMHAAEVEAGDLSRREFLTRATALGVSATAAYGMIGMTQPAQAA